MLLKARQFEFTFPRPALVMGILNVTPDSFSDGGKFLEREAAVEHALQMREQGADIIDIGGESTRPGALPLTERDELRRVMPVFEALAGKLPVPISIDTRKVAIARAAIEAGSSIINDVEANRTDPAMWDLVAEKAVGYICMHMRGNPETMQIDPVYTDVVAEVHEFFRVRLKLLVGRGVATEQIIFDPGIGFGKKIEHNLALIKALKGFADLDRPLLIGVSRKSFLSKVSGGDPESRLAPGLACACAAVAAGARLIRTHDVLETVQAVRMTEALLSSP